MNKKYLSVFLFSALFMGTAGTFTSCKDYDDDIESLQGQIDSQGTSLESELSSINSSISSLQSAQSSLEAAISSAESAAEAAALEAQTTAIATAAAALEEARATLQEAIDTNTTAIDEVNAIITEVEATMAEVVGRIQSLESFVATTESALADLQAAQATLESSITTLSESMQATLTEHGQRLAALEAQTAALEAYMKDTVGVQIDDIMSQLSGLSSLEEAIADVDKLLAAYQASNDAALANTDSVVASLKAQLEAAQAELAAAGTSISGLDSQVAALEEALEALQEGQLSQADLDAITEQITESVSKQIEELSATITAQVNADLDLLSQALSKQVTHVSLYVTTSQSYEYLNLVSAEAVRTWTFGEGLAGSPVSFTLGDKETFEDSFLLRVSPTNATLDKSNIKLVNSNMESLEGLVEIESIEAYTGLVTRATSANGLWQVNVKLVDNYDSDAYKAAAATYKDNGDVDKQILYAVMVGDSTKAERQVVSEYGIILSQQNKTLLNELTYDVDDTSVDEIHNRWDGSAPTTTENGGINEYEELTWATVNGNAGPHAQPITSGSNINVTTDGNDARNIFPAYSVDVNQTFTVSLEEGDAENIRAFYVTLDSDCAAESAPSELNAWQSYTIEGLNTVTDESSIDLTITSSSANGDYIGFRVYAVNYDGSLVDPDGKAFYVYVGKTAQTQANLVLSMESEIVSPLATTMESNTDAFSTAGWGNAQSYELVITDASGNDVTNDINIAFFYSSVSDNGYLEFYDDKNTVVDMSGSNKATATSVKLRNVTASELKDGMTYTLTITAKNATSGNVARGTITFTKELPSFPSSVYPFTGQLISGNLKVYPNYDGSSSAVYDMQSSWHGLTDDVDGNLNLYQVVGSNQTATVTYSATTISAPASVVNPKSSAYGTKYPMEFSYNYGPISYRLNSSNQYAVQNWLTYYGGFTLQLGNYVDDCTYEMSSNVSVTYPGGVGQESTIRLDYITVTDWYGYEIDLTEIGNGNTSTNEGKYFDEVETGVPFKVQFITTNESGNEVVDEYYTFDRIETVGTGSSAYEVIVMVSNTAAATGNPVETKVRLTFKDKFGNEIVKDVEGSFTMNYQQ